MSCKIRVLKGRSGYENDSSITVCVRVYIFKDEIIKSYDNEINESNEFPNDLIIKLKEISKNLFQSIHYLLVQNKQVNNDCGRLIIYYNEIDNFYSILYGLRYNYRLTNISEIRYAISLKAKEINQHVIFINNFDTHLPVGLWDIQHCEEEPILDYNKIQSNKLLFDTKKENQPIKKRKTITKEGVDN